MEVTAMAVGIAFIINAVLIVGGVVVLALFIVVLLKLNKALNIWLAKNTDQTNQTGQYVSKKRF